MVAHLHECHRDELEAANAEEEAAWQAAIEAAQQKQENCHD
jgi:hypothetical protein